MDRPEPERHELAVSPALQPAGIGEAAAGPHLASLNPHLEVSAPLELEQPTMAAVPLAGNVHALVPLGVGQTQRDLIDLAEARTHRPADRLDRFDTPERDRIYGLACQFVAHHVRVLPRGSALKGAGVTFPDPSVVISERHIHTFGPRPVALNWAVRSGRLIDVTGHRVAGFRLKPFPLPQRRVLWAPGHGDRTGLAYLLANVCAILGLELPEPLAAEGELSLRMNEFLDHGPSPDERSAAAHDAMAHFVFTNGVGLMPGMHGSTRYWPVEDGNEAVFSMLSAGAHETTVPGLKRRWRIKMAMSWVSMLAALSAVCVGQFASFLIGYPVLLRWMWAVTVGLALLSSYATHRFWRIDR